MPSEEEIVSLIPKVLADARFLRVPFYLREDAIGEGLLALVNWCACP